MKTIANSGLQELIKNFASKFKLLTLPPFYCYLINNNYS